MFDDLKFRFANAKRVSEFPDRASELVVMAQQADRLTGEQRDIISAFFADLEYLRVEIPAIITALEARLDEVMRFFGNLGGVGNPSNVGEGPP